MSPDSTSSPSVDHMVSRSSPTFVTPLTLLSPSPPDSTSTPTPTHKLGPLDSLVTPHIPVAVLFIYPSTPSSTSSSSSSTIPSAPSSSTNHRSALPSGSSVIPIDKFIKALKRLLDFYPHLSGRLRVNEQDGSREIVDLGEGAELVEAKCNSPLASFSASSKTLHNSSSSDSPEVLLSNLPGEGNDLLPPFPHPVEETANGAIMSIQHTTFSCGAVCLGVRILHTIVDADGFFGVMRDLSEIYEKMYSGKQLRAQTGEDREEVVGDGGPGDDGREVMLDNPPRTESLFSNFVGNMSPDQKAKAREYKPTLYYSEDTSSSTSTEKTRTAQVVPIDEVQYQHQALDPDPKSNSGPELKVESGTRARAGSGSAHQGPQTEGQKVTGRMIRFSPSFLSSLKKRASPSPSSSSSTGTGSGAARSGSGAETPVQGEPSWISTFSALSAHVYQHIHLARLSRLSNLSSESSLPPHGLSPTDILSPVNIRSILSLRNYPSNALITTYTHIPPPILENPSRLLEVAKAIHDMVRPPSLSSKTEVEKLLKWFISQRRFEDVKWGFRFGNGSLMLSQWNKFDMYGITFGATTSGPGRPGLVAPPFTGISLVNGLGYYLPTPPSSYPTSANETENQRGNQKGEGNGNGRGEGGIDLYMALEEGVWVELEKDTELGGEIKG